MTREGRAEPAELFEIELAKVERESELGFGAEIYMVSFECRRDEQSVDATVEIDADTVATLDILPRAMSEMHVMFTALAEQTRAWLIEKA